MKTKHRSLLPLLLFGGLLAAAFSPGLHAQVALSEGFESSVAGSGTPPTGWSLIGVSGGTPFYATSPAGAGSNGSGGSSGLAGQVNSTTTPTNTEFPGAYLVHSQSFSLAHPLSGTFDFQIVNEAASNDDVGFIIGAVADGITGTSKGEFLYVRLTEGNNSVGGILQDGDGGSTDRVDSQASTFSNDIWYRATVTWTPTSGTTGNFSFVVNQLNNSAPMLTLAANGFTFDSAAAQLGFGSINDTIRFDNVNFTGTASDNTELAFKGISLDPTSGIHLLLAGQTEPKARIMCVGDSITEGGTGFFVYRPVLNSQLLAAGYRFEFVGSKTNTQGGVTLRHEGYSGKRADQIATILAGTFPGNIADIVLLHAGHNNDATVDTEAVILNRVETATRSMIATARTHNPDVIVVLAQVITSSKLPKYSYIPNLNLRLAQVAADLNTAHQPVILVNQANGWDPVADTVIDQVHPAEGGATKMADKWFAAVAPLLE